VSAQSISCVEEYQQLTFPLLFEQGALFNAEERRWLRRRANNGKQMTDSLVNCINVHLHMFLTAAQTRDSYVCQTVKRSLTSIGPIQRFMPGFHHSVAVLPLLFRRSRFRTPYIAVAAAIAYLFAVYECNGTEFSYVIFTEQRNFTTAERRNGNGIVETRH